MSEDFTSWLPKATEPLSVAAAETVATMLGLPGAGLLVAGAQYVYNRRHLLFNKRGRPIRAYNYQGQPLPLNALVQGPVAQRGTLSLNVDLTSSARALGLRNGDPVTIVLTGNAYVQASSGLVVPARVNQPLNLAVPQGSYSLAAFGSRRDALFTTPDPFTAVGGNNLVIAGSNQLAVPLIARGTLAAPPAQPQQGCNCAQCQAARAPVPSAGCNCAQCQAARVQIPAAGCNCPQCQAARLQAPVAGCNCPQCQASRW